MFYEPTQKNKAPDFTALALFLSAAVLAGFSRVKNIAGPGVLQTLALICFGLMIYSLVRFRFTRYRYEIKLRDGRVPTDEDTGIRVEAEGTGVLKYPPKALDFVVDKSTSSGRFVRECVISLGELKECRRLPSKGAEKRAAIKSFGAMSTYKYVKNMVGAEEWLLVARTDTGMCKIIIEPDQKMAEYLTAVVGCNKEERKKAETSAEDNEK